MTRGAAEGVRAGKWGPSGHSETEAGKRDAPCPSWWRTDALRTERGEAEPGALRGRAGRAEAIPRPEDPGTIAVSETKECVLPGPCVPSPTDTLYHRYETVSLQGLNFLN